MAQDTITFTEYLEDGSEKEHELPCKYEVCPTCRGKGKHSLHLGAITQEDRERDWDHESWEEYMRGGYDRTCDRCGGKRVVAVVDRARCPRPLLKLYDEHLREEREYQALCESERRMGA